MEFFEKYKSIKQIREKFDLVLLQELPYVDQEAHTVVLSSINRLREGGNLLISLRVTTEII